MGLGVGLLLLSAYARKHADAGVAALGGAGILACAASVWFDRIAVQLYAVYDYWHSSPEFFLMRCGLLLIVLFLVYAWCRWGWAQKGFSPIIQLGNTSLLVYWAHIEFVYGRFSILPKGKCSIATASLGLLTIFLAMLALSVIRTRTKGALAKVWQARSAAARAAGAAPAAGS